MHHFSVMRVLNPTPIARALAVTFFDLKATSRIRDWSRSKKEPTPHRIYYVDSLPLEGRMYASDRARWAAMLARQRAPILAVLVLLLLPVLLVGCGDRLYVNLAPPTCLALDGDVSETTEYRSKKGGWVIRRQSCSFPR